MNHRDPRETYWTDNLDDSPLTDDDREELRRGLRTLLTRITDEHEVDLPDTSIIRGIRATRMDGNITLDVYLDPDATETDIIANEHHPHGELKGNPDPHLLRDLGDDFEQLEADLINELVIMLDLPETTYELQNFTFEPFGFLATTAFIEGHDNPFATFSISFAVPNTTQEIYDEDRFDIADRIGLPMID